MLGQGRSFFNGHTQPITIPTQCISRDAPSRGSCYEYPMLYMFHPRCIRDFVTYWNACCASLPVRSCHILAYPIPCQSTSITSSPSSSLGCPCQLSPGSYQMLCVGCTYSPDGIDVPPGLQLPAGLSARCSDRRCGSVCHFPTVRDFQVGSLV